MPYLLLNYSSFIYDHRRPPVTDTHTHTQISCKRTSLTKVLWRYLWIHSIRLQNHGTLVSTTAQNDDQITLTSYLHETPKNTIVLWHSKHGNTMVHIQKSCCYDSKRKNTMIHVPKIVLSKFSSKINGINMVKMQTKWQCQCKSKKPMVLSNYISKKHGIIMVNI